MNPLPYGRQWLDESDIAAVLDVLRSDWLTCGPVVEQFESALAAHCGVEHAVAVNSGTAALHLAMRAAGLGPGDRVLTSSNTFLASANAAEYVGAIADFADIDPATRCLSPSTVAAAWKPDVKAVIAVDYAGYPCATRELADFVHQRGAILIEDACHALGGAINGTPSYRVGGLPWVDMTTFSFHPVKTLTTGEGGAILMNRDAWAEHCRVARNHGMVRMEEEGQATYRMQHPGFNYRITDIQCALGVRQLAKLDAFVRRRQEIVDQYNQAFCGCSRIRCGAVPEGAQVGWHLYALWIDFDQIGCTRGEFRAKLAERGIGTQVHYYPVHLQPYYAKRYGYGPGKCPVAEDWYSHTLSLPLFPAMTDADVYRVIEGVAQLVG